MTIAGLNVVESNVYNRVRVDLVTHDLGNAISSLDVELARKMEELVGYWA